MIGIRTCVATNQYPPQVGGVGHSTRRIAGMLAAAGVEVHVAVFVKRSHPVTGDAAVETCREGDITVHRIQVFLPPEDDHSPLGLTRYNREMFDHLTALHQRHRFDLLHGMFLYPAGFIASSVARLSGIPSIVSIRGNDIGKYAFDPLRRDFVRSALENADRVTTVATSLSEFADRTMVPIAGKARTILNSLDIRRQPVGTVPQLALRGTVIGSAGLFRYKKGLVYLFEALSALKRQFEFTLLLAGDFFKEEDRRPHLELLDKLELTDRTIVTGKIPADQMANYLQLFDLLVFPSLFAEGCPLSMLEGMAMGKAVIGSRSGAIPEIIRDRENGLLVPPASTDSLIEATRELIEDTELRCRLGDAARETVGRMTVERESGEWMRIYRELTGTPAEVHAGSPRTRTTDIGPRPQV